MNNRIIILDFGSQYTQLIARRTRELGIYSEIHPYHLPINAIKGIAPKAIILSGGPSSVYHQNAPNISGEILSLGIPILGICYGLQVIAQHLGAKIIPAKSREFGLARLEILRRNQLLKGVKNTTQVWMSHGDKLKNLPEDCFITGSTDNTKYAVIESHQRKIRRSQGRCGWRTARRQSTAPVQPSPQPRSRKRTCRAACKPERRPADP